MQTGITNEPPRPRPPAQGQYPEQIIYTLDQHDYVAYWMLLWDRGVRHPTATSRHSGAVAGTVAVLFAVVAALFLRASATVASFPAAEIFLWLGAAILLFSLVLAAFAGRGGVIPQPARDAYLNQMKVTAAAMEAEGEVINRARIHWLMLEPDALVIVSELRTETGGLSRFEQREARADWDLLKEVTVAEHHVFLLREDGAGWFLPLSAFADREAATQFADKVRASQRAAEEQPMGPTDPDQEHIVAAD